MRPTILALFVLLGCTAAPEPAPPPTKVVPVEKAESKPGPTDPPPVDRSGVFDPASFELRCAKDDECMGIETTPCRKCGCTDAAIATRDRERYAAAVSALACPEGETRECRCASLQPWCDAGKCAARPPQEQPPPEEQRAKPTEAQAVDLKKYDLSCKRDDDCTNVRPSPCGKCGCDSTPLREADRESFYEERAKIVCARTPDPHPGISCGGCPGYTGVCKKGKCAIETR